MSRQALCRLWIVVSCVVLASLSARAACSTCADFHSGVISGTVSFNALSEASGIAASARNPGVLWTHNDGSSGRIWALSTNAARLATYDLKNVEDVEDIAVGPGPVAGVSYLYVGDIGGNVGTNATRTNVTIVRIAEPAVDLAWASDPRSPGFSDRDRFTLVYPDGSYDAEALLVDPLTADVWVVTKETGLARFYRANLNAVPDGSTVTLEYVLSLDFHQASAGDISADGTQIVLRNEDVGVLWSRCDGESISNALLRASQSIPLVGRPVEPNGEAIAFLRDGTGYVTISEGSNPPVYFFRSTCPAAPRFTLSMSNASVFVGGVLAFHAYAVGFPDPVYSWRFNGQIIGGQNGPSLVLSNVALGAAGQYELVASNANGMATNSAILTVRTKPDLRITEVMSSAAASPGVPSADWWELTSFETQPVNLAGWRFNDNSGGLVDPFLIAGPLTIAPGESIVFVEELTADEFRNWWGATNLPPGLQVVSYTGNGLSLAAGGDSVRLWDSVTVDENDTIASVDFGAATDGVSFHYDPATQQFGGLSQVGVDGAFRAALATDVGSPGRIMAPALSPNIQAIRAGDQLHIVFAAEAGRHYALEVLDDVSNGTWTMTGETIYAQTNGLMFFEREMADGAEFFRLRVE